MTLSMDANENSMGQTVVECSHWGITAAVVGVVQGPLWRSSGLVIHIIVSCTGARRVIHRMVYGCTPRLPPNSVPVLRAI